MKNFTTIGLTAMTGGLYSYAMVLFGDDFYKGLLLVGISIIMGFTIAILQKKGYPIGK